MSELRYILVILGAIVIALIFVIGRRRALEQRPEMHELTAAHRRKPEVDDEAIDEVGAALSEAQAEVLGDAADAPPAADEDGGRGAGEPDEMLVTLHVTFAQPRGLNAVREALEAEGLQLGTHRIYHRMVGGGSVFAVANMVEPGVLDGGDLDQVPGLSMFCQLPGPRDATAAFADLIATARRLAGTFGGEVLDENRSTLTRQTARLVREQILAFHRRRVED